MRTRKNTQIRQSLLSLYVDEGKGHRRSSSQESVVSSQESGEGIILTSGLCFFYFPLRLRFTPGTARSASSAPKYSSVWKLKRDETALFGNT